MNKILIDDDIGGWGITPYDIASQLKRMTGDIEVHVSSRGGSVFEGIEIHNLLKEYNKGQVHTICTSLAASIAGYIMMAGDKISFYDNATFMYHNAWLPVAGDFNKLRKIADVSEGLSSILKNKYISISGKKEENIILEMNNETFYFGNEILTNGFCHEIISTEQETTKNEAVALASEGWKACSKKISENFNEDEFVHFAAKLTKDGFLAKDNKPNEDEVLKEKVALNAKQKRQREIEILEREDY